MAALRQALAETFADPDFLAEAEKIGLSLNDPRSGEELLRVIERAYAMPPEIVDPLNNLHRIGNQGSGIKVSNFFINIYI